MISATDSDMDQNNALQCCLNASLNFACFSTAMRERPSAKRRGSVSARPSAWKAASPTICSFDMVMCGVVCSSVGVVLNSPYFIIMVLQRGPPGNKREIHRKLSVNLPCGNGILGPPRRAVPVLAGTPKAADNFANRNSLMHYTEARASCGGPSASDHDPPSPYRYLGPPAQTKMTQIWGPSVGL